MPAPDPQFGRQPYDRAELSSYTPSLREKVAYFLANNLPGLGDDRQGVRRARDLTRALETVTPLGGATLLTDDIPESARASAYYTGQGDYKQAAMGLPLTLGMAMLPGSAKGAKAIREAASGARRAKVGVGLPREAGLPTQLAGREEMPVGETSPLPTYGPTSNYPNEISTRNPTAVKRDADPTKEMLLANYETYQNSPQAPFNTELAIDIPGLRRPSADWKENAERYIQHAEGNLEHLYNLPADDDTRRMSMWYEGANKIANRLADKYSLPPQSVAGALAALSPQKDWFMNVSLAERATDIVHQYQNVPLTRDMLSKAPPKMLADPMMGPIIARFDGKRLADIEDPVERAIFVRLFDETNFDRRYRSVLPEGDMSDYVIGQKGPAGAAWGSLVEIRKALGSLESGGDVSIISGLMGDQHKVRSFYNNIISPYSKLGHVTGDTHAVGANQFRPLSGNTTEVAQNFGSSLDRKHWPERGFTGTKNSSITGLQGTYPLNAEAYRRVAARHGMDPRAMQSVTWEVARSVFPKSFKSDKSKGLAAVDAIWQKVEDGVISPNDARQQILKLTGGYRRPEWFSRGPVHDQGGHSSYAGKLSEADLSRGRSSPARGTSRGGSGGSGASTQRRRGVSGIFIAGAE